MHPQLRASLDLTGRGTALSAEQAIPLLPLLRTELLDLLAAARITTATGASRPFTCGIVNAKSGLCQENCAFCAQSGRHAAQPPVYPLVSADVMLNRAETLSGAGVNYLGMVTSGTGPVEREFDQLCAMAERITANVDIKLCASLGLLEERQARRLKASGFTSYHHNLETARSHYPKICTTHDYDLRTRTVLTAKKAGLRVCSGGIFGIGESWEQRIELSTELSTLDVDSIPINFLVPVAGTPLAEQQPPDPATGLALIALLRLMHPDRDIVVCGGRANLRQYGMLIHSAGANGLMVGDYLTVKGEPLAADMEMLETLGVRA